jgi:predicted transposase/invertase (TIGR01784 family)
MRHPIDPKIDCVFKALLGSEENRALLVHFLNAILGSELPSPVTEVQILNPYNEREYLTDKLSIVDVKARDADGRLYQAEIQLLTLADLPARIQYHWAHLYSHQLQKGQDYGLLRPAYSIWLLAEDLLPAEPAYVHRYRLRDERGRSLLDHGGIWLFELNKFSAEAVTTEEQRWLKFFKEGEHLDADAPPDWMQTPEMRQVMNTLKAFSDQEHAYDAYQCRQDYLRIQAGLERHRREAERGRQEAERALAEQAAVLELERQAKDAEREAKEAALQAKEAALQAAATALAEVERLRALLVERETPTAPPAS